MARLDAKLFGTPQVTADGRPVSLPYKKADALLYYLLLKRQAPRSELTGMMVDNDPFEQITIDLMRGAAELLGEDVTVNKDDFDLRDLCGPGYAISSEEGNAAVALMAKEEGLFLDPVYTGKAFAGLVNMAKEGAFRPDDRVLFLHTGGTPLFFDAIR